jgi:pimeloyl-ACP methyl ester carboxylesterase
MATITQGEAGQIERANATGRTPVVFIHGLWLLPSSWDRWAAVFEEAGYAPLAPGWPDDPATVEAARANPNAFAGKGVAQVADHFAEAIGGLTKKPAIVGHSFGGLIAQILAGRGLAAVSVAVDPAPFRGVLPLPIAAIRTTLPVLRNPANRGRAVTLSFAQFRYGWANALGEEEAKRIYEEFHVAAPGKPIFQAAMANLNPGAETKVDSKSPKRGPLLIFTGESDHAVPPAMSKAAFKKQSRNEGVTEHIVMPGRDHSLTIDDRWREVADAALAFVKRFA